MPEGKMCIRCDEVKPEVLEQAKKYLYSKLQAQLELQVVKHYA